MAGDKEAKLLCMVNPTNPTGDYMDVEAVSDSAGLLAVTISMHAKPGTHDQLVV